MSILSALYGRVAEFRRQSYDRHPERQLRLVLPVISVGNVASGGSGKTPVVASLARLLRDAGECPAILSRGYGRLYRQDGAVVVSDANGLRVPDARTTGDEPQMLARMLPGVPVVVCGDRYLAGRLAEARLGATAHLLDDGFQHLRLARDIDLVLVSASDLEDRLLPSGRLREPLVAARRADALLVPGTAGELERVAGALHHESVFGVQVGYGSPVALGVEADGGGREPLASEAAIPGAGPGGAVAVAAIARPGRFFNGLRLLGWDVRREVSFRDHHWFTAADVARVEALARDAGTSRVLTTQKDAVRLEPVLAARRDASLVWEYLPITATVEPASAFREWLLSRVREARA